MRCKLIFVLNLIVCEDFLISEIWCLKKSVWLKWSPRYFIVGGVNCGHRRDLQKCIAVVLDVENCRPDWWSMLLMSWLFPGVSVRLFHFVCMRLKLLSYLWKELILRVQVLIDKYYWNRCWWVMNLGRILEELHYWDSDMMRWLSQGELCSCNP